MYIHKSKQGKANGGTLYTVSQLAYYIHRGLEQFMKKLPDEVNSCKADDGRTALHIAAANNHLDMVCLLAAMVMPHSPHLGACH